MTGFGQPLSEADAARKAAYTGLSVVTIHMIWLPVIHRMPCSTDQVTCQHLPWVSFDCSRLVIASDLVCSMPHAKSATITSPATVKQISRGVLARDQAIAKWSSAAAGALSSSSYKHAGKSTCTKLAAYVTQAGLFTSVFRLMTDGHTA